MLLLIAAARGAQLAAPRVPICGLHQHCGHPCWLQEYVTSSTVQNTVKGTIADSLDGNEAARAAWQAAPTTNVFWHSIVRPLNVRRP